ncbi:P-loop containing nucleoside triphosphate hydrolase protein [Mycena amicta]|nr:P-loop containing nucleoside triphosphate hydrolase protein [Mycena amicta]
MPPRVPPGPQTPRKQRPARQSQSPSTPRTRRSPAAARLEGTRPARLTNAQISSELVSKLQLKFVPDDWQVETISRILRGFDSIFLAGTGYGKSLVFQGLAALGGRGKVAIVITPLKALEMDQVQQAIAKGIDAIFINEDNTKSADLWKRARTTAQLVYISPEMSKSTSFTRLWKDAKFRTRCSAVIVDEAHCIADWGKFRPEYNKIKELRSYLGFETPVVACTATCTSETFKTLWNALDFGHRPFWGIDVGSARKNLLFLTREISNPKNPVLNVLNMLPAHLDDETPATAIEKSLFYFDSEAACTRAVQTLRSALPPHLRGCIQSFSSTLSEDAKKRCWDGFVEDRYRIICSTDAAGMGCNVPDVRNVVIFECPSALSVVAQRWGRAARSSTLLGMCLFLVQKWAFRPAPPDLGLAVQRVKGKKKKKLEPATHTQARERLDKALEAFVNSNTATSREDRESQSELQIYCLISSRLFPSPHGPRLPPADQPDDILEPRRHHCCQCRHEISSSSV